MGLKTYSLKVVFFLNKIINNFSNQVSRGERKSIAPKATKYHDPPLCLQVKDQRKKGLESRQYVKKSRQNEWKRSSGLVYLQENIKEWYVDKKKGKHGKCLILFRIAWYTLSSIIHVTAENYCFAETNVYGFQHIFAQNISIVKVENMTFFAGVEIYSRFKLDLPVRSLPVQTS